MLAARVLAKLCFLKRAPSAAVPAFAAGVGRLHTSPPAAARGGNFNMTEPTRWLPYNDKIFPPQAPDEKRRPAYVCHMKPNVKYSPKKMWYLACFVRGMSVDEALKQLSFLAQKGAVAVRQCIEEAQQLAVDEHNVEFKSNLWVAESFVGQGVSIKGYRRHARGVPGFVKYRHSHYLVRLEEGRPPPKEDYYWHEPTDGPSLLRDYLDTMRRRKIISDL